MHVEFQAVTFAYLLSGLLPVCVETHFSFLNGSDFVFFFWSSSVLKFFYFSHDPPSKASFKRRSDFSHFYQSKTLPVTFLCLLIVIAWSDCLLVMERGASCKEVQASGLNEWGPRHWLFKQKIGGCLSKESHAYRFWMTYHT